MLPSGYIRHALHDVLVKGDLIMENGKRIGKRFIKNTVVPDDWSPPQEVTDRALEELHWDQLNQTNSEFM